MQFFGNRSFLLIKPKKTFFDWVKSYDEDTIPEKEIYANKILYMIDEI